ncbi:MAG: aromatic hydrocarbon degradation protein [Bacteroidales bacterium]|jgi:long-chain fatty acid transport protein|nr:aromatic hydrocarbon degradation protein [Bacteroidales bacterium]
MIKKVLLTGIVAANVFCGVRGGGLLTNTNQSVHFLRNPARDASIGIDAAYSNPAGLAFLPENGFYFSLNNQSAIQTRTIKSTFAPFAGLGENAEKEFKGKTTAFFVPSVQAACKIDKWAFSLHFGIIGGGGSAEFGTGLPSFESTLAIVPDALRKQGVPGVGRYSLESQLTGTSIIYGGQVGASYAFVEHLSAYAGLRYTYVSNAYEGYLRNIQVELGGNLLPANTFLSVDPAFAAFAPLVAEKEVNCSQTGAGFAPIIGLDYNWNGLNIGARYEFKTSIDLTNKTTINTTGVSDFEDGAKTPYDMPALFTLGAQYAVIPALTVSAGYHHFFDSNADMAGDKQQYIHGGVNEYLLGLEYKINDIFMVSCGAQYSLTGVTDDYQSDLNFSLNNFSAGIGGTARLTKNISLTLAYLYTRYSEWTKESANYVNIPTLPVISGKDVFGRTSNAVGIGLDFRF